jgi:hypothetical protein
LGCDTLTSVATKESEYSSAVMQFRADIEAHANFLKTFLSIFCLVAGMKEPVYDMEPFLTPNQKKRLQVKEVFAKKYTNM